MNQLSRARVLASSALSGLLAGAPRTRKQAVRTATRALQPAIAAENASAFTPPATDHVDLLTRAEWLANTPSDLVAAHLNIDPSVLASLPRAPPLVIPG